MPKRGVRDHRHRGCRVQDQQRQNHCAAPAEPQGLKWWTRPVPMALSSIGVLFIAMGLVGAGSTDTEATSTTRQSELPLPAAENGQASTPADPASTDLGATGLAGHALATGMPPLLSAAAATPTVIQTAETGETKTSPAAGPESQTESATDSDSAFSWPPSPTLTGAGQAAIDIPDPTAGTTETGSGTGAAGDEDAVTDEPDWQTVTVQSGDSLAAIFQRAGLGPAELHRLINADERAAQLQSIYPDDQIHFHVADDQLQGLRYALDQTETLVVDRENDAFQVSVERQSLETRIQRASGTVNQSLFVAGVEQGLSHGQIMRLMSILEWRVDFGRDVRAGDHFTVAYESYYVDDEHVRDGPIVAARYVNRGREIEAVRYTDPEGNTGYYDPQGENVRKAFMRRPVTNARISSSYDPNRRHPILGITRPHLGTDFAARTGTPVKATGSGRVVHAGRKGGYGHTVIIEHANRYRTLYAHMNGYASGISVGTRVEQGQTIGYVGSTGMSTGAHLHYEFIRSGEHRNPMRVDLPNGDPVAEAHMDDFRSRVEPRLAYLDDPDTDTTQLAMRDQDSQ